MAKVITVSRTFPAYHPKAGQPTYFVEQILNALGMNKPFNSADFQEDLIQLNQKAIQENKLLPYHDIASFCSSLNMKITSQKLHTIRAGHRWKQGDKASIRVWSGKPYDSPQIIIAPDVELVQVVNFKVKEYVDDWWIDIGTKYHWPQGSPIAYSILPTVAKNDGLSTEDLLAWFKYPKPFDGKILAWRAIHYA